MVIDVSNPRCLEYGRAPGERTLPQVRDYSMFQTLSGGSAEPRFIYCELRTRWPLTLPPNIRLTPRLLNPEQLPRPSEWSSAVHPIHSILTGRSCLRFLFRSSLRPKIYRRPAGVGGLVFYVGGSLYCTGSMARDPTAESKKRGNRCPTET